MDNQGEKMFDGEFQVLKVACGDEKEEKKNWWLSWAKPLSNRVRVRVHGCFVYYM